MDILDLAWRKALGKRGLFLGIATSSVFFIVFCACAQGSVLTPGGLAPWLLLCAVPGGCIRMAAASRPVRRKKTMQLLARRAYDPSCLELICRELENPRVSFYSSQYRLSLYITPSWLILISANGSVICKRSELRLAEQVFLPESSDQALCLYFFDGDPFLCRCTNVCEEVVELINKEKKECTHETTD